MSTLVNEQSMAEVVQEHTTPLFRPSCTDCGFCEGLRDMGGQEKDDAPGAIRLEEQDDHDDFQGSETRPKTMKGRRWNEQRNSEILTVFVVAELWQSLSFIDQYLALWILLAMIAGILIGVYAVGPSVSMTRRSAKRVLHQKIH